MSKFMIFIKLVIKSFKQVFKRYKFHIQFFKILESIKLCSKKSFLEEYLYCVSHLKNIIVRTEIIYCHERCKGKN